MSKQLIKKILRIIFILTSIGSLFFVPWILVKAWILPLPETVQDQVTETLDHGFEGMIVYVDQAGQPPAFYTGGWHDRDKRIAAKPEALFKIASISKLYVAVCIAKLAHANRLSLDQKLSEYFPELIGRIEHTEQITLKMMVGHRSGIPNYTSNPKFWQPHTEEALEFALDLPASFAPNQGYEYSNTNYLLLRRVIAHVVGYDHQEFIKEEILLPLGLKNTFSSLSEVNLDDVMSGYHVGVDEDLKGDEYGMLATAQDGGTFLRALNDGSVFEEGEQEIYTDIYVYEHGGLVPGYQSLAEYHKDIDAVVVQFLNTTDFEGYEWNLSEISINRIVAILEKE